MLERGWPVWMVLSEVERRLLLRRFPGLEPPKPPVQLESLEEIDKLMRERPEGELAAVLSGAPVGKGG